MDYGRWRTYVPMAQRRLNARRSMRELQQQGADIQPIEIEGRKIARSFWGEAWCRHIESLGEYANRLPRGRTYVRNGSVCHLAIERGRVTAFVSGSAIYTVEIAIDALSKTRWKAIRDRCTGRVGSLVELLHGRLSDNVMGVVTNGRTGLFPRAREIHLDCDCPDWATVCKHVAAVLYGVGSRLDERPELLFELRGVNHEELVDVNAEEAVARARRPARRRRTLAAQDLTEVFGIDLETGESGRKKKTHVGSEKRSARVVTKRKTQQKKESKTKRRDSSDAGKKKVSRKKIPRKKVVLKSVRETVGERASGAKQATKKVTKKTAKKTKAKVKRKSATRKTARRD